MAVAQLLTTTHPAGAATTTILVADSMATTVTTVVGSVVVAVLALIGSVYGASTVLRASNERNRTDTAALHDARDRQHDERVEAENTRLRDENTLICADRERINVLYRELQERHARLRVAVIEQGFDPDEIIRPPQRGPTPA